MRKVLVLAKKHYQNNGLVGASIKRLTRIRGGSDFFRTQNVELVDPVAPSKSETSQAAERIDEILKDLKVFRTERFL